ncbi:helix-turn-helix domain-containing protein [Haloarcula sp. CBA1127]|uniref:helix-turn-helix domain-containing protein n=1 Tax=Haloarcula sp. CBA1127 TaxID=1765055 RepID=UPI00073F1134|nr:helix-turn-helix domain-containing protein [Haloarcula sp. CBA1127]
MATMMRASVPTEQFALSGTFQAVPEVEFDAVRFATHGTDRVVPLLWATNADTDSVGTAITEDETVRSAQVITSQDQNTLLRMDWTDQVRFLTRVLVGEHGTVVSARGSTEGWTFRILFPERDAVSSTCDAFEEYHIDIERITALKDAPSIEGSQLTDGQFSILKAAVDEGYYEIPRRTNLQELASDLGVSHQALSEQARRGHRALIESVIMP